MQIQVTFYGRLKQDTGTRQQTLTLADNAGDPATIQAVIERLVEQYPALREQLATVAYTVGAVLVGPETPVQDGDQIGFLPPVSGG
ncbi:MoaD/ThiS family protein [Chloroflexota bacterium]